jgi:2-keto-4-pentenoate hydratase/2-oxohepta-3-ene-1,7-dioic acid hydratase in catechol pathway
MKLLRVGDPGAERPCAEDETGTLRDISAIVSDIGPETIPGLIDLLTPGALAAQPVAQTGGVRIGAPIARPRNVWCIGLNYSDHAAESGMPVPDEPILFTKPAGTVCGPNDPILKSPAMRKLDWEVELAVVIGKPALEVPREAALEHVLGYTIANDVSERHWQIERGGQWTKGKGYPNFCPTGPWLVTRDELGEANDLAMSLDVNGERKQTGTTATMIFGVAEIVSYLSTFCLLEPGDLICTGTPPGVGMGRKPPENLEVGDTVRLEIEKLGVQESRVVASGSAM